MISAVGIAAYFGANCEIMNKYFLSLLFAIPVLISYAESVAVQPVRLQAHVAEKVATPPGGNSVTAENGLYTLTYNFTTEKHDALFFELDIPLEAAEEMTLQVNGDGKGHTLFVVVRDQSGENFFFPGPVISFTGWKSLKIKFNYPVVNPGEKYASIWGGDGNQQVNFPLRGITIGLNDTPDTTVGNGVIQFREIQVK